MVGDARGVAQRSVRLCTSIGQSARLEATQRHLSLYLLNIGRRNFRDPANRIDDMAHLSLYISSIVTGIICVNPASSQQHFACNIITYLVTTVSLSRDCYVIFTVNIDTLNSHKSDLCV